MAKQFCLLPEKVDEFKKALKSKELNIVELINMTSERRTKLFEKYAGAAAADVNLLFEKKLVLKNRIVGLKNWASKLGEVGRYDPKKKAKINEMITEYRARQQERILSPKENESFLNDLADAQIGTHITRDEATKLFELTKQVETLKKNYDVEKSTWTNDTDRLQYGASKVVLEKYMAELKDESLSVRDSVKAKLSEIKQEAKEYPVKAVINAVSSTVSTIANNSVAMVATLDNSFLGRQGIKTLYTHPTKWLPAATQSFVDFGKTLGGQKMKDALMADIYSRPNYLNGNYDKAKLLPQAEEQFPTSLPERIWGVGRLFKASEAAFTGSAIRMRTDTFDLLHDIAIKDGVEMTKEQVKDLGTLINAITARGSFGEREQLGVVRLVLWAPKMLKGNYDVLTGHSLGVGLKTNFARKQAAKNWVKIISISALIMAIANALDPGSAETDPRSSDFGKIKVGNTRIDFTGGAGSLVTLAARLLTGEYKKATTDEIVDYSSEFGKRSRFDAVIDFITGKANPPARVVIDYLKGVDFEGKPVTPGKTAYTAFTPLILQKVVGLKDDQSVDYMLGIITDFLGGSSNTYEDANIKSGIIPEDKKIDNQTFIESVALYAEAMGTDPETAFNRIFTGQRIRKISGDAIIVERMPLEDSQEVKKKANADNPQMKLDHTIPLELGGGNDMDNLKLVTTGTWRSYTKVENALGKALKEKKITKKEAGELILKFKGISDSGDREKYGNELIEKYK